MLADKTIGIICRSPRITRRRPLRRSKQGSLEESNNQLRRQSRKWKRTERLLRLSEERYRVIFENTLMGIYQSTPEGSYIMVNQAFARIFGYNSPSELVHSSMHTAQGLYANSEDRKQCMEQVRKQGYCRLEVQIKHRDGTLGWVLNHAHAIRDKQGHVKYYEGFVADITEKKMALQALEESQASMVIAFRANPAPVIISTIDDGRFIDVNERLLQMLGYTREELIGRTVYDLAIWADSQARSAMIRKFLRQGFLREELIQFRTKSGDIRDIFWSAEIIKYQGRDVILSLPYDITERKRALEEKEKLFEALKKALADVKKLSGLLPICASCKKIRNDEGYWEQIEVYIKEHSEADFSHGICPDCVRKLYPELFREET